MKTAPGGNNFARLSAAVDLLLLRPQVAESSIGKLSEDYQFSPRIILGLRGVGNRAGQSLGHLVHQVGTFEKLLLDTGFEHGRR